MPRELPLICDDDGPVLDLLRLTGADRHLDVRVKRRHGGAEDREGWARSRSPAGASRRSSVAGG